MGGGIWNSYPIKTCEISKGFFCNLNEGDCSNSTSICSDVAQTFTCTSEGLFPDPFDCQRYHMCVLFNEVFALESRTCPGVTAYSAASSDCSANILDRICSDAQFSCESIGDTGAWPGNSNIFYICVHTNGQYHPQLHRCTPGYFFQNGTCVLSTATTTTVDDITFNCEKFGLFPHETNCMQYFYCNANFEATLNTCAVGSYFNNVTNSCVVGTCW